MKNSRYNFFMFLEYHKLLRTVILCVIAEALNFIMPAIFYHTLKIPLFFDTIFTVAVVFYCGLVPGLCVSVGYNLINSLIWVLQKGVADPFIFFYTICGILIVLSTWVVSHCKAELKFRRWLQFCILSSSL